MEYNSHKDTYKHAGIYFDGTCLRKHTRRQLLVTFSFYYYFPSSIFNLRKLVRYVLD